MKKMIGPLLIILAVGGIVAGVLLVNRNIKHKDDVNAYKKSLKAMLEPLKKDADDLENALKELIQAWKVYAMAYGDGNSDKGNLVDVLNQPERKPEREKVLKQMKLRSNDRADILKKAEAYPSGEKGLSDDFLAYWDTFCAMADMYENITLVESFDKCSRSFAELSVKKDNLYKKLTEELAK